MFHRAHTYLHYYYQYSANLKLTSFSRALQYYFYYNFLYPVSITYLYDKYKLDWLDCVRDIDKTWFVNTYINYVYCILWICWKKNEMKLTEQVLRKRLKLADHVPFLVLYWKSPFSVEKTTHSCSVLLPVTIHVLSTQMNS